MSNRMTMTRIFQRSTLFGLVIALLVTAALYWPGLYGGFEFDDYPNIVDNHDLHMETLDIQSVIRAALASPSSELKRPLASLSFAANFFITRLDPFWMKLSNLLIHLLNGVLIYALSIALIRTAQATHKSGPQRDPRWIALIITAGWLLLPINLTAVLYVVQRMESLANIFVLLGLWGYVSARQRMQTDSHGFTAAISALILGTAAGLLSKETAVMTPLYALLIEWALFRARSKNQQRDYRVVALFLVVLFIPLIVGLSWQLPRILNASTWATRNFDLPQRLMTETRVVVDYIQWTLLPTPGALSFYHDDYPISTGWLRPWTTLLCSLLLAALAAFALLIRRRAPLLALGIALFMGAQLLTATILPLELVYEHRNYFASFGLLLALIPMLAAGRNFPALIPRLVLLAGLSCLWIAVTVSTASAWGSPLVLAQTLAQRASNSPRAEYGLGYTYIVLSKYDPASPFTAAAYAPLEKAMRLPGASILPEQALIMMNARMHLPVKAEWWASLYAKLEAHKPGAQDLGSLEALSLCQQKKQCDFAKRLLLQAFLAALSHPQPSPRLLMAYGEYAWNVMGDRILGESLVAEATLAAPSQPAYRVTLIRMLTLQGKKEEAAREINKLEALNFGGRLDADIAKSHALLNTL